MEIVWIALAVLVVIAGIAVKSAVRGDPQWQALVDRYSGAED